MASLEAALSIVRVHEGGKANLDGDPGGETNFGVSSLLCKLLGIALPTTQAEADEILRKEFWNPLYEQITAQTFATKLFDDAVNQGTVTAVRTMQHAMCVTGSVVVVDGRFGAATLAGLNYIPEAMLLPKWRQLQYDTYDEWISQDKKREGMRLGLARRAAWPASDDTIAKALIRGAYESGLT